MQAETQQRLRERTEDHLDRSGDVLRGGARGNEPAGPGRERRDDRVHLRGVAVDEERRRAGARARACGGEPVRRREYHAGNGGGVRVPRRDRFQGNPEYHAGVLRRGVEGVW